MKKLFLSLTILSAGTATSMAQTWLEQKMNGLDYSTNNPPSTSAVGIYSEPFDLSWRDGFTGIGTALWPKTKLQVHGNANIDTELGMLIASFGGNYTDFTSIFTNGGVANNPIAGSVLGLTSRDDDANGNNMGLIGIAYGNNMEGNHGVSGLGIGDGNKEVHGISGLANGNNNERIIGVQGVAEGDGQTWANFGVWGQCNTGDPNSVNVGVFGRGVFGTNNEPALVNIGVHGVGECSNSGGGAQFNCGVYGQNINCTSPLSNGGASYPIDSYAGYFDGDVYIVGSGLFPSDQRLKENVAPLTRMIDQLSKVNVYSYNFRSETGFSLPMGKKYGVMSQELERIFPDLVKDAKVINHKDPKSYRNIETIKSVDYISFIPLLIQSTKELNEKIEQMDPQKSLATLADLKKQIDELQQNLNQATINNNASQNGYLNAYPNPSNNDMVIDIRQVNCDNCIMMVTDLTGKLIRQYNIRGQQQKLNISSKEIGTGIFQCNLVSDGKVVSYIKIIFTE